MAAAAAAARSGSGSCGGAPPAPQAAMPLPHALFVAAAPLAQARLGIAAVPLPMLLSTAAGRSSPWFKKWFKKCKKAGASTSSCSRLRALASASCGSTPA